MRRLILLALLGLLLWAHSARAAGPTVTVQASPQSGGAPLTVTFAATGNSESPLAYRWDFGDGSSAADTPTVQHTYAEAGRYTATVTVTDTDGATAQASVDITAYALSLSVPSPVRYGKRVAVRGVLQPAEAKARVVLRREGRFVASARTRKSGRFRFRVRLRAPGAYQASFGDLGSNVRTVRLRPVLTARIAGVPLVGSPLAVVARLRPAAGGRIHLLVLRGQKKIFDGGARATARVRLATTSPRVYQIRVWTEKEPGFLRAAQTLRVTVTLPTLATGSRGPSVRFLEQRLRDLHYALEGVDGFYGQDTYDAVIAFQKLHWLPRTGTVGRAFWRRLRTATVPSARYRSGTHLEVDKERQVLFDVRGGQVARVIPVSTGATGNTPLGIWHVYSKEPGFNALSMYYSMYFLGGFAVHGYPDVPPYPASHGCVRVPLWVAYSLYETHPYGTTVIIY